MHVERPAGAEHAVARMTDDRLSLALRFRACAGIELDDAAPGRAPPRRSTAVLGASGFARTSTPDALGATPAGATRPHRWMIRSTTADRRRPFVMMLPMPGAPLFQS